MTSNDLIAQTMTQDSFGASAPALPGRRLFLQAGGALAGSLVFGLWTDPAGAAAAARTHPYQANAFVAITPDDRVVITVAKIEMGQGTYTSIPMLIAEELEVDMARIDVRIAPPDAAVYGLPFNDQFTGGSTSISTLWKPMREAGATVRMLMIAAAAKGWKVAPESCMAAHGEVRHRASGRRIRYGKLLGVAATLPVPAKVTLKDPAQFTLIGTPVRRLDARGKVDGSARFGIDAAPAGVRFAAVAACPVFGGKLKSVDDSKARKLKGVLAVIKLADAVAVVADNTWYAKRALAALDIVWDGGPKARLGTADVQAQMKAALARPGLVGRNIGDAPAVLASAGGVIEASYDNPLLAHAAMEPLNCTVHVKADSAELWVGTQVPARARDRVARLLGMAADRVTLHGHLVGGAFGRRLYTDWIEQAVLIGQQYQGPLKVTWSREEDMQHCRYRGVYAHTIRASVDARGFPLALSHKIAGPSNVAAWAPGWLSKEGLDGDAVDGSDRLSYDIPNMRVEFVAEEMPIPSAFWRGVGPNRNLTAMESFIDGLAVRAAQDPLQYRLAMLGKAPRAAKVLQLAAERAGWGTPLPPRTGRGIALMFAWDTYMAHVVELRVDDSGEVTVQRVVCAVDCGMIVNPDTVTAQVEGGIIYGLSAAMFGEITLKDGRVEQGNFHDYRVMRLNEAPLIDVELVKSSAAPGGVGEAGTAGVGAAYVNAVFAATGKRIDSLPTRPQQLKKA